MFSMYLTSQPPSLHTVFHNVNMGNLARINENSAESEK